MEVKKSLIAVGISSVLMAGTWATATAKTAQEEDSVYQWGRWAVLAPAAGNEEVVAFAPAGTNDLGRCESGANCPSPIQLNEPTPPPQEMEGFCEPGTTCGYARYLRAYTSTDGSNSESPTVAAVSNADGFDGPVPARFDLSLDQGENNLGSSEFQADADPYEHTLPVITSVLMSARYATDGRFQASGSDSNASSSASGFPQNSGDTNLLHGPWSHVVDDGEASVDSITGYFVWGQVSNLDVIQGRSSTATYSGRMLTYGTPVSLNIDFGNGSWSGSWNGGADDNANIRVLDHSNGTYVEGVVGFNVDAGHFDTKGNLISDQITATDGIVTDGGVLASLYGGGANQVGGIVDITKSTESYQNANHVDVFMTNEIPLAD